MRSAGTAQRTDRKVPSDRYGRAFLSTACPRDRRFEFGCSAAIMSPRCNSDARFSWTAASIARGAPSSNAVSVSGLLASIPSNGAHLSKSSASDSIATAKPSSSNQDRASATRNRCLLTESTAYPHHGCPPFPCSNCRISASNRFLASSRNAASGHGFKTPTGTRALPIPLLVARRRQLQLLAMPAKVIDHLLQMIQQRLRSPCPIRFQECLPRRRSQR